MPNFPQDVPSGSSSAAVVPFGDRLAAAVRRFASPTVVGLDPRFDSLPEIFRRGVDPADRGKVSKAYLDFSCRVIDVVASRVGVVKPQAAFFEELGPAGAAALAETIAYARKAGLLVLLDAKRNDIGTTAAAYARGMLGAASAWGADALTVSPYLGEDSLSPFTETALERGCGVFILVKTSNPGGGQFQDLIAANRPLYLHVADHVEKLAAASAGESGYGAIGAVVGATYPEQLATIRKAIPHAWILIPGYGAQGGAAADVAAGFDSQGLGAIVNSSRGILFAHSLPAYRHFGDARWEEAVAAAADAMNGELLAATPAGFLRRK